MMKFCRDVISGKASAAENTKAVLRECSKMDKEYHYMNALSGALAQEQAVKADKTRKGKLAGLPVSVKDNICVKGVESRAGSAVLNGYRPLFNATAVQRLIDAGAVIIGKTAQDEFGFGTFSTNVGNGFQVPRNPHDKGRACGGSSGGSAGLVSRISLPHVSLAESTGGSIVAPASFCGVVGLCPTYGRVSRYGLIDYANSLDKIGPMAKTSAEAAEILGAIAGHDELDSTTLEAPVDKYSNFVNKGVKGLKIGIIRECFGDGVDPEVEKTVRAAIKKLEAKGAKCTDVSLPTALMYGVEAYYLIAMSETSTNLAKYCGMRYGAHEKLEGSFNEYFSLVRSRHFGKEAKRRVIIGTFARMAGHRDAYYIKAMKVRTKIINEYKEVFSRFDALVSPTMPVLPPKFSDIEKMTPFQNYMMDIMTVSPNLAGLPHISVNAGFAKNLPVGILFTADHLNEKILFQLGGALE